MTDSYKIELILNNGQKLSEYKDQTYDFENNGLPTGLIDKKYTGIGATYAEINCNRDSILVFPTQSLAITKYQEWVKIDKHNCLYVGGGVKNEGISKFLLNKSNKFNKVFVVADSLPRFISLAGNTVYDNYFLLVDEIDTFQIDTSYRSSLEYAIDFFWKFKRKAAITATMLKFSDERFKASKYFPHFHVLVKIPVKTNLDIYKSSRPDETCIKVISTTYIRLRKGEKILVAVNYVNLINKIIKSLNIQENIPLESFAVLCSENSANKIIKGVFREEIINNCLPKQINFMTSSYFVGLDVNEKYHCVVLNTDKRPFTVLTPYQIYQIIGRGRKGLLSNSLITFDIYNNYIENQIFSFNEAQVVDRVTLLKHVVDNVEKVYLDKFIEDKYQIFKSLELIELNGQKGLVRSDFEGKLVPSFFTIDFRGHIKSELFNYKNGINELVKYLSQYFEISEKDEYYSVLVDLEKFDNIDYLHGFIEKIPLILNKAARYSYGSDPDSLLLYFELLEVQKDKRAFYCILQYLVYSELYGSQELVINKIIEVNKEKLQYSNLKSLIILYKIVHSTNGLYNIIQKKVTIGSDYDLDRLKEIFSYFLINSELKTIVTEEYINVNQKFKPFINSLFKVSVKRKTKYKIKNTYYTILDYNGEEVKINRSISDKDKIDDMFGVSAKSIILNLDMKLLDIL